MNSRRFSPFSWVLVLQATAVVTVPASNSEPVGVIEEPCFNLMHWKQCESDGRKFTAMFCYRIVQSFFFFSALSLHAPLAFAAIEQTNRSH